MALSYGKKRAEKPGFQKDEGSDLISLENDDEDKIDMAIPIADKMVQPDYPWGLRISLTEKELDKLKLDSKDAEIGSYLNFMARACVKAKSEHETEGSGKCCRLELQIEGMKITGEDE